MVAVILAAWGGAAGFGASGILACTFAGIIITNVRHDTVRSAEAYLHSIGGALFAAFYTFAGMNLDTVGLAALAINQLVGPSGTRFALSRAGESSKKVKISLESWGPARAG